VNIKIEKLLDAVQALNSLFSQKLPVRISYPISRMISLVNQEIKHTKELRNNIIEKLGNKTEQGFVIDKDDKEAVAEYEKQIADLLSIEIDLPIQPIKLQDIENAELTAFELDMLAGFITE
jgi:hypothetical protein